ncbi:MAG: hypothetical protein RSE29_20235, partial [Leclercia sp.]
MKLNYRKICLFWGAMDALYVINVVWHGIAQKRIPVVGDILSFRELYAEHGGGYGLLLLFCLSMITTLSIVLSAGLLLAGWDKVRYLVMGQTPLRLLLVVPSVSFLPWLFKGGGPGMATVAVFILIVSEALKVYSLIFSR